jgi:hypothetical protein
MRWSERAGLALAVALAVAGCSRHAPAGSGVRPPAAPGPTATQVPIHVETRGGDGEYVRIVETVRGRKVYTIRALSDDVTRGAGSEAVGDLVQPHITFFDKDGTTTITDAPKARVTERDKSVVMTGGVHAHTSSGSVLSCDVLTYNGKTERFHGDGNVHLTAPNGLVMDGRHIDGDVKLQDVNVTGKPPS